MNNKKIFLPALPVMAVLLLGATSAETLGTHSKFDAMSFIVREDGFLHDKHSLLGDTPIPGETLVSNFSMPSFKSQFGFNKDQTQVQMRLAINQQYSVVAGSECSQSCISGDYKIKPINQLNMSTEPVTLR